MRRTGFSRPLPRRRAAHSRSRLSARVMRAFLSLVTRDRGKRIDLHIDYFGSGAVTASFFPASPLDTKV